MKRPVLGMAVAFVAFVGFGALTEQDKNEIQAGMQTMAMFQGLPLGGDPGDIARHWESLRQLVAIPSSAAAQRQDACQKLSIACFADLKVMNQTLASPQLQTQIQDPDARRVFAVRYYHLLYFIFQYYRCMGWGWDCINADFSTTGWPDAAEYRWQANAAKLREWLGAKPLNAASLQQQVPAAGAMQPTAATGVRSVREIEAAIRRLQSYIRYLEREANRSSDDYSSYVDNGRRQVANGGREYNWKLKLLKRKTVQSNERLLRQSERKLQQLEEELAVAREREEKAAEEKAKSESSPSESSSEKTSASGTARRFCTECGAKVAESAKFCGSCGHKL